MFFSDHLNRQASVLTHKFVSTIRVLNFFYLQVYYNANKTIEYLATQYSSVRSSRIKNDGIAFKTDAFTSSCTDQHFSLFNSGNTAFSLFFLVILEEAFVYRGSNIDQTVIESQDLITNNLGYILMSKNTYLMRGDVINSLLYNLFIAVNDYDSEGNNMAIPLNGVNNCKQFYSTC